MAKQLHVLVTGVGGDLGQAIVKALKLGVGDIVCHGCDIDSPSPGSAFVDSFHAVPRADDASYIDVLNRLCLDMGIEAVIPGSEPETFVLSRAHDSLRKLPSGAVVVCQDAMWISVYGDKLACMNALASHVDLVSFGDGADETVVNKLRSENGFPLVVKERLASGGKNFGIAHDQADLDVLLKRSQKPLVQRFIDGSGGEFSVGVFASEDFVQAIAFKRELGPGGCSWYAETSDDSEVLDYALRIAKLSRLRGSANVQVRKSSEGVRLLEVNPRFSSLSAARAACGFNDVEWALELALGCLSIRRAQPVRQIRFHRFFSEMVDFGSGLGRITEWDPKSVTGR